MADSVLPAVGRGGPAAGTGDRAHRIHEYLTSVIDSPPSGDPSDGIFQLVPSEVFRLIPPLALGRDSIDAGSLPGALDRIAKRRDCADFVLAGLQRILFLYRDNPLLTGDLREPMEKAVLDFCYWYDQPGIRGMCFHTENHQILFHACEILGGALFPDEDFSNSGRTGQWHIEHGTTLALRWIDERARFGFVEWLSCYFEEDLLALLNLFDFAPDPVLRRRAGMLVDTILFEIAVHSHNGILGTARARTYAEYVKGGREDPVTAISWLVFGSGRPTSRPNIALTALATSGYRVPQIISDIATDTPRDSIGRLRSGLSVAESRAWGFDPNSAQDQMFYWACQTARHPLVRDASIRMCDIAGDDWLAKFVAAADDRLPEVKRLVESGGAEFDGDAVNTALTPGYIVTFRNPEYLLSCAQDFRPGRPGYQQHVWQATLDIDAVVFTNHPGTANESSAHTDRPNFWAGNRYLPRAAQHRNVVVCIHHAPADDPLPFSHAYFPRKHFDEVAAFGNWTLGRKGDGYIALYSQHAALRCENGPAPDLELRANSPDNIWICEMGSAREWGSFEAFAAKIAAARIDCKGLSVDFDSPSIGRVQFAYTGPMTVSGKDVPLSDYPRYDNRYCQASLGDRKITIEREGKWLTWNFGQRTLSDVKRMRSHEIPTLCDTIRE
jgi:hypothetical protein